MASFVVSDLDVRGVLWLGAGLLLSGLAGVAMLRFTRLAPDGRRSVSERLPHLRRIAMGYRVAVVGATGNVGREMLNILEEVNFPVDKIHAIASRKSIGVEVGFGDQHRQVRGHRAVRLLHASTSC